MDGFFLLLSALLLTACGESTDTSTEQATTVSSSGDMNSNNPATSADSAADKPVPTGPAATMYPTMESSFDSDGDGFMTKNELRKAIDTRFNEFSWPSGYATNLELLLEINTSQVPENAVYENGSEYTILGFPHMCAWGYTWLAASRNGDQQTMNAGMNQLTTVTLELPTFQLIRDTLEQIFQEAKLGSPAKLQQYLDTNCNMAVFSGTPQAVIPATGSI